MAAIDPQALAAGYIEALRCYHRGTHVPRTQLDVSEGVDSAAMLGLLAKILDPEQITRSTPGSPAARKA